MAAELAGRGGLSGAELNRLIAPIPLPDGSELPLSALVAAYVAEGPSFGAQLSRELLSDFDPPQHAGQVCPALILALFHRDVLLPMAAAAEASAPVPGDHTPTGFVGHPVRPVVPRLRRPVL